MDIGIMFAQRFAMSAKIISTLLRALRDRYLQTVPGFIPEQFCQIAMRLYVGTGREQKQGKEKPLHRQKSSMSDTREQVLNCSTWNKKRNISDPEKGVAGSAPSVVVIPWPAPPTVPWYRGRALNAQELWLLQSRGERVEGSRLREETGAPDTVVGRCS